VQDGDLGNVQFVKQHGALGALFTRKKAELKMGETPSVLYLLRGDPAEPMGLHWGGQFASDVVRGPHCWRDDARPEMADGGYVGAKTVNRWRAAYLRDWQRRMDRCSSPALAR